MDMHVDYFAGEHLYHDSRTCYGICPGGKDVYCTLRKFRCAGKFSVWR